MDAHEKQMWAETRAKGKFRFIILQGVIITGGLYALMMTAVGYFIEYGLNLSSITTYMFDSRTHTRFFLFATAFGAIMGVIKWNRGERAFTEATAKEPAEPV